MVKLVDFVEDVVPDEDFSKFKEHFISAKQQFYLPFRANVFLEVIISKTQELEIHMRKLIFANDVDFYGIEEVLDFLSVFASNTLEKEGGRVNA